VKLTKNEFCKVLKPLLEVGINHLFADAVVEGHVSGVIYVDNAENPASFYVSHPYGMSLLFGKNTNVEFNSWLLNHALNAFKTRERYEWLQVFPENWNSLIATQWADCLIKSMDNTESTRKNKIEVNTRVNFKFNKAKYLEFKQNHPFAQHQTIKADKFIFENMQGSVIPGRFWDDANDFSKRAIAFSIMDGDNVASTAFSAFVIGKQLEIGIETSEKYRGKGYAIETCVSLIDYCLEHGYEPVWACRFENIASFLLAQKLGFEPTIYCPFYRLSN